MNNFDAETEYSLDKDLQWTLVNKRISLYLSQIKEHKLYAFIAMFCVVFAILFGPQKPIIDLLLGFSCILWGLTFAYTCITENKNISIVGNMELAYRSDNSESFFMLMHEMKYSLSIIHKQLKTLQLLNTLAACYTMISIMSFTIENYINF